jgi:hypothetical protein
MANTELVRVVDFQEQSERQTCRVIVLGRDGTEVLLKTGEAGLAFPAVEIPRWERLAENLTAAVKEDWGCDAICLFTPNLSLKDGNSNGKHYEVMECWCDGARTSETVWKSTPSLSAGSFLDEAELRILGQSLVQLDQYESDPSSPFARRGWLAELRCWTAEIIRPFGLELTGPFCQYNASPSFSLVRFETSGPAVWFKAVGEPNQREFPIMLTLSRQFPKYLPELLGGRADWNGWLSLEAPGTNLRETREIALWQSAAESLARLQMESVATMKAILDAGAHDLRTETLSGLVQPFLAVIAQLMEQQTKIPPPVVSRAELRLLGVAPSPYDTNPDDFGLATFAVSLGGGANVTATRLTDADPTNVIAFARNTTQVLNIVTGGGAVNGTTVVSPAMGVFFPAGMNAGPNGFK